MSAPSRRLDVGASRLDVEAFEAHLDELLDAKDAYDAASYDVGSRGQTRDSDRRLRAARENLERKRAAFLRHYSPRVGGTR